MNLYTSLNILVLGIKYIINNFNFNINFIYKYLY